MSVQMHFLFLSTAAPGHRPFAHIFIFYFIPIPITFRIDARKQSSECPSARTVQTTGNDLSFVFLALAVVSIFVPWQPTTWPDLPVLMALCFWVAACVLRYRAEPMFPAGGG